MQQHKKSAHFKAALGTIINKNMNYCIHTLTRLLHIVHIYEEQINLLKIQPIMGCLVKYYILSL